jgi:diguanylate cyclase (GGDEF)-like protein
MKVLIAEDDPVSRRLLQAFLVKSGYEVIAVEDGGTAWEVLQAEGGPRLAVLDWMMPRMDGVEVCRGLRQLTNRPYTYVLLLTAKDEKRDVTEGLDSGADDYLVKPFHPQELRARLRVGMRILALEDDLVAARERLQFKATHDLLTGAWNRGAILEVLERELSRARRQNISLGILLADLDHFKAVNDEHGHLVGDQVLQEVARRLTGSVRDYDAVGRYGGEEFLLVMPGCDASSTRDRAEQIRVAVSKSPVRVGEEVMPVSLSIGAVSSAAWGAADADALLRAADVALYRAKSAGRNRVELALPEQFQPSAHPPGGSPVPAKTE